MQLGKFMNYFLKKTKAVAQIIRFDVKDAVTSTYLKLDHLKKFELNSLFQTDLIVSLKKLKSMKMGRFYSLRKCFPGELPMGNLFYFKDFPTN